MDLLVTWLITAIALLIVAWLPTGVEIADFGKALIAALVFGLLNALIKPVLSFIAFPLTFITLGLFSFVINALIFGLAAYLVTGFNLRYGFWSALIGSIVLTLISRLLGAVLLR